MGRSHGMSGLAAGLGLGAAVDAEPLVCLLLGGIAMVGAYVPDIDHRRSTITRAVPVLGALACWLARATSRSVYAATKGRDDEDHSGEHRHLTHTVVFAVLLGAVAAAGATALTDPRLGLLIGSALAVGCVAHCVGDALTLSGCPFLWPLPIAGETWYELRPPRMLRFRTGGVVERLVAFPAFAIAAVLLAPGVGPLLWPVLTETWATVRQ